MLDLDYNAVTLTRKPKPSSTSERTPMIPMYLTTTLVAVMVLRVRRSITMTLLEMKHQLTSVATAHHNRHHHHHLRHHLVLNLRPHRHRHQNVEC